MNGKLLLLIVQSLSAKEIAHFYAVYINKQRKQIYASLLEIILANINADWEKIKAVFHNKHSGASIENATSYLYKLILELLIHARLQEDEQYEILYDNTKCKILKERNLTQAAAAVSTNAFTKNSNNSNPLLRYQVVRNRLAYLSQNNFEGISEKELIALQENGRESLRELKGNHEHYTLYELLKYRILHQTYAQTSTTNIVSNDLILNELAVITQRTKSSVESKKIHYLFQSFYFMAINDYNSATKTFVLLNDLFEQKIPLTNNNLFDYFSMLDGILDSLRTVGKYSEMLYFIDKLEQLPQYKIPEYFQFLIKKTIALYRISYHYHTDKTLDLLHYIQNLPKEVLLKYAAIAPLKQTELILYVSLSFYKNNNPKQAIRSLGKINTSQYKTDNHDLYRIVALYNFILHYEQEEFLYLEYEINAYIKNAKGLDNRNKIEQLLLKIMRSKHIEANGKDQIQIQQLANTIKTNPKESQSNLYSKYFNFWSWILKKCPFVQ